MSLTATKNMAACQLENESQKHNGNVFHGKISNIISQIYTETIVPVYNRVVVKIKEKRQNDLVLYHDLRNYIIKPMILSNGSNRLVF